MKIEDVIKTKIREKNTTQKQLAEKTGFKSQANIAGILNNTKSGMRIDNAVKLLNALDCIIVVRDKENKNEWEITN